MEKNIKIETSNQNLLRFAQFLLKKLFYIILFSVIFASAALGYSFWKDKTTYTAKKTVMLVVDITGDANFSYYDGSLAQAYLKDVSYIISQPTFVSTAQEKYKELFGGKDAIIPSRIGTSTTEESLIFSIYYTDSNEQYAKDKLDSIIVSAKLKLNEYIKAEDTTLKEMQNRADVTPNKTHTTFTILGFAAGLGFSLVLFLLIFLLDNTLKDKAELENITGAKIFALIEDREFVEDREKKERKRKRKHKKNNK